MVTMQSYSAGAAKVGRRRFPTVWRQPRRRPPVVHRTLVCGRKRAKRWRKRGASVEFRFFRKLRIQALENAQNMVG